MRRRHVLSLAAAGVLAGLVLPARAVVTNANQPGDVGRNTTAPPVGHEAATGWSLQGNWGRWTGTPISPTHFITAVHFDPAGNFRFTPFSFRGVDYGIDHSYGNGGYVDVPGSDLRIFKISGAFPEHAQIHTEGLEPGKHAPIFGRGTSRGAPVKSVSRPLPGGWLWGPHDNGLPHFNNGASTMSWGMNMVESVVVDQGVGELLRFTFNSPGTTQSRPDEANITDGDSGGGVFVNDGGVWELAGINYSTAADLQGLYSVSSDGSNPFNASLHDPRGFFFRNGTSWAPINSINPAFSHFQASRISSRAEYIYSVTQNALIHQTNWNVPGNYIVADVNVSGTLVVGDTTQPSKPTSLVANHVRGGTLDVRNNASVVFRPNNGAAGMSKVTNLIVASLGQLDLADNALIEQNGDLADLTAQVKRGRNGGAWNGKGIISSEAASNPGYGLAVIRNTDNGVNALLASFKGQSLDPLDVIVAYVPNGDTDLDLRITADDYARIDRGYLRQWRDPGKYLTYRFGDFNYDGMISALDYALIDAAFFAQNPAATSTPSGIMQTVPEPGGMALLVLASVGLLHRRRR